MTQAAAARQTTAVQTLDAAIRRRQQQLLKGSGLAQKEPPYCLPKLIEAFRHALESRENDGTSLGAWPLSVICALVGELCGTALIPLEKAAGGVYPGSDVRDWETAHAPLRLLRNALCHPGAIVPRLDGPPPDVIGTHVHALVVWAERDRSERLSQQLAQQLRKSSNALLNDLTALWALRKVVAMGEFELEYLRRRQ